MGNVGTSKKRGLGRGLGALLINTEMAAGPRQEAAATIAQNGLQQIAIDHIYPNPRQPRTQFSEDTLAELAASIRVHGIIQPLIVTQNPVHQDHYSLIAGERRWRAAQLAGLTTVPAIVREASSSQLIEWALIENVQRADLNPVEEASAYQALMDEFALTQDEVADRVGKSRSTVANIVRLLRLPLAVQEALIHNRLSAGHARALLALEQPDLIELAAKEVVDKGLNVRQTEVLVKQWLARPGTPAEPPTPPIAAEEPQITHLENRFRQMLGTRVNLNRNANGTGRLVIHFYNDEDLEQIYRLIARSDEAT